MNTSEQRLQELTNIASSVSVKISLNRAVEDSKKSKWNPKNWF